MHSKPHDFPACVIRIITVMQQAMYLLTEVPGYSMFIKIIIQYSLLMLVISASAFTQKLKVHGHTKQTLMHGPIIRIYDVQQ